MKPHEPKKHGAKQSLEAVANHVNTKYFLFGSESWVQLQNC
jgi:hypothetical protein